MAAIDKIYGTNKQWDELFRWLANNRPQYCRYLYSAFGYESETNRPISNFPISADKWLYKNCHIRWVKERLEEQYNGDPYEKM